MAKIKVAAIQMPTVTDKMQNVRTAGIYLEKIKDDVRIIATAARIENMVCENGQLSIEAKAIDHIQVNMRIRLPGKPEDLCAHTESGKNMELQSVWDEKSRTVLLSYRSNNEKVHITGKLKYES